MTSPYVYVCVCETEREIECERERVSLSPCVSPCKFITVHIYVTRSTCKWQPCSFTIRFFLLAFYTHKINLSFKLTRQWTKKGTLIFRWPNFFVFIFMHCVLVLRLTFIWTVVIWDFFGISHISLGTLPSIGFLLH